MSQPSPHYELFLNYLNNTLEDIKRRDVETLIANNLDLQKEFNDLKTVHELTIMNSLFETEEKLNELDFSQFETTKKKPIWPYGLGLIAILLGSILWYSTKPIEKHTPQLPTPETSTEIKKSSAPALEKNELAQINKVINTPTIDDIKVKKISSSQNIRKEKTLSKTDTAHQTFTTKTNTPAKTINVNIEEKTKQNEVIEDSDPCTGITITYKINTEASCTDDETGAITLGSPNGGTQPYQYSLNNNTFDSDYYFDNLAAGKYVLSIKDKNNCISKSPITIEEKNCQNENEASAFNPQNGEIFLIPIIGQGQITIFNSSGIIVFQNSVSEGDNWNGTDNSGNVLSTDVYTFVIQSDNETHQGEVTIINY